MEFCNSCGAYIFLKTNLPLMLVCNHCGFKNPAGNGRAIPILHNSRQRAEGVVVLGLEGTRLNTVPIVRRECQKCHDNRAYCQTAVVGNEEARVEILIFRCIRCKHAWRERG